MTEQPDSAAENEQRPRLQDVLASLGEAVIVTDVQGRITYQNRRAEELTGWSREAAAGHPLDQVFRVVAERDRQVVASTLPRVLRDGITIERARPGLLIAKDGTEHPIEDRASPLRSKDAVTGVVLTFKTLSRRRGDEATIQQNEERFRLLVESVRDYAIFMLDQDGVVRSWNLGAERIKGYRADEIIGRHFSTFYPVEAIQNNWPQQELASATAAGRFEDEGWRLRKDGTRFWANVVITALHGDSGELQGFAKITRDLTQRRELEHARARAEVLSDLDRRKDQFLAMLSHELRNPLAALRNATRILLLDPAPPSVRNSVRNEATAIIERQLEHLTRLIDDLLDVSRIATGQIRMQRAVMDLRLAVGRAGEATAPLRQSRAQVLTLDLPARPVWVDADSIRIEQVIGNLLINAAKYSPTGRQTTILLAVEDGEAVLRVRDQGFGIAPELLPHVFDMFTQGERSLDRSDGGMGVGLRIVRGIVELHGGKVEAHSPGPGGGSEFVVRLPIAPPPPDRAERPAAARPPATAGSLRILVVDDNHDAADTCAVLLRHWGHDVRTAYSGSAGLEAARAFRPNVVLLDIGLPELDGYAVAREIRSDPELKGMHLIAVSGYGQPEDRQRSEELGFLAHLVKPMDHGEVQRLLSLL